MSLLLSQITPPVVPSIRRLLFMKVGAWLLLLWGELGNYVTFDK